jgi:hypothetical protein
MEVQKVLKEETVWDNLRYKIRVLYEIVQWKLGRSLVRWFKRVV